MTLKVRNSLSRKVEEFKPLNGNRVTIYTCGPTVYNIPHIGNYRTFFMVDMIRRYLEYKGYEVFHVMNITDIDDKTIRDSAKEKLSLKDFTEKYTKIFFEGIDYLNIKRAHLYPRATDHIPEMITLIQKLESKGYTYESEDGVYFAIRKFKNYGKLINLDLSTLKVGERARADTYDKENVQDFVLWKKSTEDEIKRGVYYDSPWGKGRPGWHIECSAMSMKYLGETLDIHTSAIDLKFPHHTNEIAQSESATGKTFVRYWLHGEFLNIKSEKMSKSLGNYTTLVELMGKYDADTFRYFFLSTKYDTILEYSEENLIGAKNSVERLRTTHENVKSQLQSQTLNYKMGEREKDLLNTAWKLKRDFEESMDQNFDTPKGLKIIHELAKSLNIYLEGEINYGTLMEAFNIYKLLTNTFGLFEKATTTALSMENKTLDELVKLIIELRNDARKRKDFQTSDKIRDKLASINIVLEDSSKGTTWKIKE